MFIDDLSLLDMAGNPPHGKAKDQYLGTGIAATDTKPRTGVTSATTTDIRHSTESHGNERHDVAALVAGRCLHGAKNNRVWLNAQIGVFAAVNA
jgi:hypothetical protein